MNGEDSESTVPPLHPGEILVEEFLEPLGISQYALAKALGVDLPRIAEIAKGRRAITAGTALRLARFFGTSAEVWMNLQARYDLEIERVRIADSLARVKARSAA